MAKKNAYKIIILLSFIFLFCPFIKGQSKKDTIHLIFENNFKNWNKVQQGDTISFYIDRETFIYKRSNSNKVKIFKEKDVKKDKLCDINLFMNKAYEIKKRRIKEEKEVDGTIPFIKKSEYFHTIYLYEFREGLVYRYPVKWKDAINCL